MARVRNVVGWHWHKGYIALYVCAEAHGACQDLYQGYRSGCT